MCRVLRVLLLAALSANAAHSHGAASDAAWEDVARRFEKRLADERVVGGAILFTSAHAGRRTAFFGVQDLQTKAPVGPETIFHWASITKTFTAIAVMQLAERQMLDLQAPAVRYLPELRSAHYPFGPIEDLRVVHLLTHTAGFRAPTWPWRSEPWHPYEPRDWSQLVAMMPYTDIQFRPGERYAYSNPGYTFLGRIVESVSGEDIEQYIDKNVLRPLGMQHAYFDLTPPHLLRYRSNNYFVEGGALVANGVDFDTGITSGNGGLNASVSDMARYVEYLSGRGRDDEFPLPRSALQRMWQPVAKVASDAHLTESMGYGFFVIDFDPDGDGSAPASRFVGHTGSQMGFRSFIYVHPASASALLIALNTGTREGDRALYNETRLDAFRSLFSRD